MPQLRKSFSLVVAAVLSILFVIWLLTVFGLGTAWRRSFLAEFVVENRAGQTVYVTLLGVGANGRTSVLPQFASRERPGRAERPKETALSSGESRAVIYNWDDINFTWIAVRGETGPWKAVRTGLPLEARDPSGTTSFTRPDRNGYMIPPLEGLPDAPDDVQAAAGHTDHG